MVKKNKRKKEEIAEDWCFLCKDGGSMRVCDFKDCLKVYHPVCAGEEDSFLEADTYWCCASHYCFRCHRTSKFKCICCPTAVCGRCLGYGEFAIVKRDKGFCSQCSKLALLIEENADVDSDGGKVDFKDSNTYECYFLEYYEAIKIKEGLNSSHVHSAHNFLKNGKNNSNLDLAVIDEGEDDSGESEDGSDYIVSDYDDMNDTAGVKSMKKKQRCKKQLKSTKGNVKNKKKEFIGWGSRSLVEFLNYIGRDTVKQYSEHDVASIIIEYCKVNNLFDSKKKRKVLCDAKLSSLLGRKSVNRNKIQNLLAHHFAENVEEFDDITSSSENRDDNGPFKCSSKGKFLSTKSIQNIVPEERKSSFAAIVSSNIKLVYLKRSLVEELLKQQETFNDKVMGSFVRVKSDPNDYLQKNSYLLVQVVGINRSSKNNEINKEVLLQLSYMPKDVPTCKISDDDFTEEECQDLYQRMKNGLLKQPTILELEQKARSLHEDIIKHWIPRELTLLQNRIDMANEKGRRRELAEYIEQKLKLQTASEQSRLLSDIPKVIPEIVDSKLSQKNPPRNDRREGNGLPELAMGKTSNSVGRYPKHNAFACWPHNTTDVAGPKTSVKRDRDDSPASAEKLFEHPVSQDKGTLQSTTNEMRHDRKAILSEETSLNSQTSYNGLHCPRNTRSRSGINGRKLNAMNTKMKMEEKQSLSVAEPIEASANDKQQDASISDIPMGEKIVNISTIDVIKLSHTDEQDESIADISAGRKVVEDPESPVWNCLGPFGERSGPYSLSVLRRWIGTASYHFEFKVWKTGQSETQAVLLTDALSQSFPSM
ncbi:PREDICTED: uncharacterized protein At5g08430-like isoform X2 [Lupinus angustifolius]|uniref:uncharacterized protein At5g08430-like isoform X2 n=1 Tax=Lupinus angustifolius TaxID=3871 RepID=UPI00092EC93E|nr:PREDICTED: uncharacterized protein At5g08430-like isoform X2 [Lupinus angustifolius]